MPAIINRMLAGLSGEISRKAYAIIEAILVAEDIAFGSPVQLNASGEAVNIYDETKPIYGTLVRPYPTQSNSETENSLGVGGKKAKSIGDVLRCGYISVRLSTAELSKPVKGTPVKVVFTASGNFGKGEYAVSQGIEMTGCTYMGAPDASGNIEIAVNI